MTAREAMAASYRREKPARTPISPEIWTSTVLEYSGLPFHKLYGPFAEADYNSIWLAAQKSFGFDAWLLADLDKPQADGSYELKSNSYFLDDETIETTQSVETRSGRLDWVTRTNDVYEGWGYRNPVKDFEKDIAAYAEYSLADPTGYGFGSLGKLIRDAGEDALVSGYIGGLFINWLASGREGDIAATLLDLADYEDEISSLYKTYTEYILRKIKRLADTPGIENLCLLNGYSSAELVGPRLYEKWEKPLLEAAAAEVKRHGLTLHLHQHGKCLGVIDMIANSGVDLVDSLERPSAGGDVGDIRALAEKYGDRIAFKGNMDPATLCYGSKADIERETREIVEASKNARGFIIGTGDSVLEGTPFKNLELFYTLANKYL